MGDLRGLEPGHSLHVWCASPMVVQQLCAWFDASNQSDSRSARLAVCLLLLRLSASQSVRLTGPSTTLQATKAACLLLLRLIVSQSVCLSD